MATLLDHLQHNGGRPAEELIARYSTKSILVPLKDFYAKRDAEMRSRVTTNPNIAAPACEPPLVAYFLRVDPAWGEKVLRESLAERGYTMGRCWLGIIGQTAVYYSGPVWERVAIDALQDPAVPVKIDAVKSLAQYGSPGAKRRSSTPFATGTNGGKTAGSRMTKASVSKRLSSRPRRVLRTGPRRTLTWPPSATCA